VGLEDVKHDRVGHTSARTAEQFKANAIAALRRLQRLPRIVRAFFADPDLQYITS